MQARGPLMIEHRLIEEVISIIGEALERVTPKPLVFHVSARSGDGMDRWFAWLESQFAARSRPVPGHPANGHSHI